MIFRDNSALCSEETIAVNICGLTGPLDKCTSQRSFFVFGVDLDQSALRHVDRMGDWPVVTRRVGSMFLEGQRMD
jgi:hypothetical protein